jgi:hypothetical protein
MIGRDLVFLFFVCVWWCFIRWSEFESDFRDGLCMGDCGCMDGRCFIMGKYRLVEWGVGFLLVLGVIVVGFGVVRVVLGGFVLG